MSSIFWRINQCTASFQIIAASSGVGDVGLPVLEFYWFLLISAHDTICSGVGIRIGVSIIVCVLCWGRCLRCWLDTRRELR